MGLYNIAIPQFLVDNAGTHEIDLCHLANCMTKTFGL